LDADPLLEVVDDLQVCNRHFSLFSEQEENFGRAMLQASLVGKAFEKGI